MKVKPSSGIVLIMLFLFQTLNFFDKLVFGLSGVPIMRQFHITPAQFGLIGSGFFLFYSLSGVLVGLFLVDRVPTKYILVSLALIWSCCQIPIYFTGSLAVLVCMRIALGIGEGPGLPSAMHLCYNWFPNGRRNLPSAIILQGISAGFLIGGPLLSFVIVHFGWRPAFLLCGLLGIVWAAIWSIVGGEGPYAALPQAVAPADATLPASVLWLDRTIIGVILMSSASYWVVGMAATWLPPYLQLGLGYSPVRTGWIIAAVYALQSPMLLAGSLAAQRIQLRGVGGRRSLAHPAMLALLLAGFALLAAIAAHGILQLLLIAVAFATPSLTTVFGPVILAHVALPAQRSRLIVVIYSGNAIAALFSTSATGWVVGLAGGNLPLGFAHAMALAAIVLLLGALASLLMIFPDQTAARFGNAQQAKPGALPLDHAR